MSARLQQAGPEQRHELSDDLESFVHVLNYCALKYLSNTRSNDDVRIAEFISDVYHHVRRGSGGQAKGSYDKLERLVKNRPFVELRLPDHPLSTLLRMLSELCSQHYHHIRFPPPKPYVPPSSTRKPEGRVPSSLQLIASIQPDEDFMVDLPPRRPVRTLPEADPDQSPLKDHVAIGSAFLWTLKPTPASKVRWPSDKIKRDSEY